MMLSNVTGIVGQISEKPANQLVSQVGRISEKPANQLINQAVTENAHKHKAQL